MTTREDWTSAALEYLLAHGSTNVKVERLAREMGVTKGSFYWHFKDRDDLLQQTASHWHAEQLGFLDRVRSAASDSPEDRLRQLIEFTATKDGRPDLAMRMWARQAPWVDKLVAEIDRLRLEYCQEVMGQLGYSGDEALLRANLIYYYQVADQTLSYRDDAETRSRLDALRLQLLL